MIEGDPESPKVMPLNWRNILRTRAHVAAVEKFADVLDMIARRGAERGISFEEMAAPALHDIEEQERQGKLTPGQAEFMRDESDALLQMINWAYDEGTIDQRTRTEIREAVN